MLKPSDFNNAVPQFSNGNYASNPINPQYVEEPSSTDYNRGTEPLQTLPAQWWNWFMNKFTSRFNKVNIYVKNLFNELAQLLSLVNVTPDGTESAVTDGQLKNAFKELYPDYINTKLALESTYVKKTQKVNNHALSGDVTVTKSDVGLGNVPNVTTNNQTPTYTVASSLANLTSGEVLSTAFGKIAKAVSSLISHIANVSNPHSVTKAQVELGNVVNTGDSATPTENGTTKFTTGGAYTLKKDLTDIAESLPTDAVLHYSFDEVPDYPDGTAVYKHIKDFTSTSDWSVSTNNATYSVNNGVASWTLTNTSQLDLLKNIPNIAGKLFKIKFRYSISGREFRVIGKVGSTYVRLATYITNGRWQEAVLLLRSDIDEAFILSVTNNEINSKLEIESIYIGDGSYSTPIIDNTNGQNNATNNGGIATKGISGKGAYFPSASQYCTIPIANLPKPVSNKSITLSVWVKIPTSYTADYDSGNISCLKPIVAIGAFTGVFGLVRNNNSIGFISRDSTYTRVKYVEMRRNEWVNLVAVYDGTTKTAKLYENGIYVDVTVANLDNYTFGGNDTYWRVWSNTLIGGSSIVSDNQPATIDDLLIFDRALSDTEVTALYQNKANTPKYYDINNYIIDNTDSAPTQNSTDLVTSGGVYTELAKKANTTYVDTELAKKVDKTTTVNGHALSGNVTVTKGDVDLGNVVNTGDSATPISGGTTKFTTGGAYTELNKKLDKTSAGDQVRYSLSGNTLTITSLA